MNFAEGDRVLVNVAPFIGSQRRAKDSVTCEILAVTEDLVQVRPEPPCRGVLIWIDTRWVDRKLHSHCDCVRVGDMGVSV